MKNQIKTKNIVGEIVTINQHGKHIVCGVYLDSQPMVILRPCDNFGRLLEGPPTIASLALVKFC